MPVEYLGGLTPPVMFVLAAMRALVFLCSQAHQNQFGKFKSMQAEYFRLSDRLLIAFKHNNPRKKLILDSKMKTI